MRAGSAGIGDRESKTREGIDTRTCALGFTLIEVLLVLAIIGVVAGVSTPYFVKSIRGNRLRTAARVVVMAGRYARSMAVLRQKEMVVSFNLDAGKVSIGSELTRDLDRVAIEYVEFKDDELEPVTEGSCSVRYGTNGRCTPYSVKVSDHEGASITVSVDSLSSARTEEGS